LLQSAHEFQEVLVQDDDGWAFMLALQEQEKIYGLGLTQGDFNRRGEEIVSDNPAYKSLPLAWSNLGWGLYVNSLNRVIHSVGTDDASQSYQIRSADALFDFFVFLDKPEEVFNLYTQVTGRTGQPDLSSMGL